MTAQYNRDPRRFHYEKPLFLVPLLALLLSACSSSSSYFSAFTAEGSQTQYKQTGTVHIKDDENAVSLYVNAASPAAITLTGKLSSSSGDPSLICQYPDGAMYLIADSRTTSLDTEIPLQAGLNRIRFDGSDSVLDFELVYTGLNSPEILGYGQSQSEAETVPADAASISTGIPGSSSTETDLHGSSSNLFTKVSQPATLLEFQLEKRRTSPSLSPQICVTTAPGALKPVSLTSPSGAKATRTPRSSITPPRTAPGATSSGPTTTWQSSPFPKAATS